MDPYLEGALWPDVHQAFANEIRNRLTPLIRPHYVARLALKTIRENLSENEINVMYPDVEIMRRHLREAEPTYTTTVISDTATISPAITIPIFEVKMRMVTVEIYTVENQALITCIEVLSPANKRGDGLRQYLQKRQRLQRAGIHLLEIDLTRRGQRPFFVAGDVEPANLTTFPYLMSLWRANQPAWQVWPVRLEDRLPTVAVPLHAPDRDIPLDLAAILRAVYEAAAYDLSIDYTKAPPPPALDEPTANWARDLLAANATPD